MDASEAAEHSADESSVADLAPAEPALINPGPGANGFDAWFPATQEGRGIGSTTDTTPSLTPFAGKLWLVHAGEVSDSIYVRSIDESGALGPSIEVPNGTTTSAPPIAVQYQDSLYIFHKGVTGPNLYFRKMSASGTFSPAADVRLADSTSSATPGVAVFNDRLFVVHKGESSNKLYIRSMGPDGSWSPSAQVPGGTTSSTSPALAVFNNRLYVFHRGETSHQLYYRSLGVDGGWSASDQVVAGVTTSDPPAIAVYDGRLHVVHKGNESSQLYYTQMNGAETFAPSIALPNRFAETTPALAALDSRLVMVHKGEGTKLIWTSYLRHFESTPGTNDFWLRNQTEISGHQPIEPVAFRAVHKFELNVSLPNPQGLTLGASSWLFTQNSDSRHAITQCNGGKPLHLLSGLDCVTSNDRIPSNLGACDHLGDPEMLGQRLLVPIECVAVRPFQPGQLVAYDVTSSSEPTAIASGSMSAFGLSPPWLAVYPFNPRLIFTSDFITHAVTVYKDLDDGDGVNLKFLGELPLFGPQGEPITLNEIQGGAFSPAGHLLLAMQAESFYDSVPQTRLPAGVLVFNSDTGRLVGQQALTFSGEIEGATVSFLDPANEGHVQVMDTSANIYGLELTQPAVFAPGR